jgi:MFS superfamily sulfate permease-like transporter
VTELVKRNQDNQANVRNQSIEQKSFIHCRENNKCDANSKSADENFCEALTKTSDAVSISAMSTQTSSRALRFDRNEFAGAFGDIGTDLPLVVGMILAAGLDSASVLIVYGAMQIFSGLYYRIPMAVQPLKAVAVLVIAQSAAKKITPDILYGGGLAIGLTMFFLTITGLITWLGKVIPKTVVRGIQFGLGLKLASLALKDYVQRDGVPGYWLAAIAFIITLLLYENRKIPAAIPVLFLGAIYSIVRLKFNLYSATEQIGFHLPHICAVDAPSIWAGFLLLALPQVPLSIGNSILAARQTSLDLFPDRAPTMRKISFTYSLMNLINPFFGGVPTCHGSGGLAGHYNFGARTGGSVIIYGTLYLVLGLFFANGFQNVIQVFPMPVLGVILLFEGLALMLLTRDVTAKKQDFFLVLLVGLMASGLPYGYLIALIVGTVLSHLLTLRNRSRLDE